jgi:hypothetical protein
MMARTLSATLGAQKRRKLILRTLVPSILVAAVTILTTGTSGANTLTVKDAKYNLSFTLPDQWREIPLSGGDISGLLDLATKADPSMKSSLTAEVKQEAKAGVKIFALGPIVDQFASNVNVIVEPQAEGPSTPGYFNELGVEVKLNLASAGFKKLKTSKVHWSQGDVLQVTYTLHLATTSSLVKGVQDYVWHKGKIFIVTFSSSKLSVDKVVAQLVGQSWRWNE